MKSNFVVEEMKKFDNNNGDDDSFTLGLKKLKEPKHREMQVFNLNYFEV